MERKTRVKSCEIAAKELGVVAEASGTSTFRQDWKFFFSVICHSVSRGMQQSEVVIWLVHTNVCVYLHVLRLYFPSALQALYLVDWWDN